MLFINNKYFLFNLSQISVTGVHERVWNLYKLGKKVGDFSVQKGDSDVMVV